MQNELINHPDRDFVHYLLSGLRDGFHTGICSSFLESYECKNLLTASKDPDTVSNIIKEEVEKGYLLGPFQEPPFDSYRTSPVGIAQHKYSGKKRLIVDLSAPHDLPEHPSLNELIDKDQFSLSYVKLDDAIRIIKSLGHKSWLCKVDIKDAFKQIPIHPSLWPLHGVKWEGNYYFYTRLVFGSRSSPKIFDTLSQAITWIAHNNYHVPNILHLLDDFLTIDSPSEEPLRTMSLLSHIFNSLGVPLAQHKTAGPAHVLEYLGITLDTEKMEARLPQDKQARIFMLLKDFLSKRYCSKKELLSLLGHLVFASRVILPGRSFMSRLFEAAKKVSKLHFRIYLNLDCKADIKMWFTLLQCWNGISLF